MDSGWPDRSEMVTNPSFGRLGAVGGKAAPARLGVLVLVASGLTLLSGCVAQQADLKQTERELQRRIKQTTEEQAQTRARQNQEIVSLREQEIPKLSGDVGEAIHRTKAPVSYTHLRAHETVLDLVCRLLLEKKKKAKKKKKTHNNNTTI